MSAHSHDETSSLHEGASPVEDNLQAGPILVTGGAGFLGSHLVEHLLCQEKRVILLDVVNSETSSRNEKLRNIELLQRVTDSTPGSSLAVYECDTLDEQNVLDVLRTEEPMTCLHSAAHVMDRRSVDSPREFIENNCLGTCSLLEAIKMTGTVKHMVYVSSRSAMGEKSAREALTAINEDHPLQPINMYGASKAAAEHVCYVYHHLYQLSVNVCRMFPVLGPRGRVDMFPRRLLEKLLDGETVEIYGDTGSMRDWLYVEDAVDGLVRALWKPMGYEIINLGTGKSTKLSELIATAEEVVGKKAIVSYGPLPAGDARFVGVCDNSKAKRLLEWEPKTELRAGLEKTFEYILHVRKHGRAAV